MTIKGLTKIFDPIFSVVIYIDDEDEAEYKGNFLDIPWYMLDYKVGFEKDGKIDKTDAIVFSDDLKINEDRPVPGLIINVVSA